MPAMPQGSAAIGTYTFLFSDIEGSTGRWERQSEEMAAALRQHDALMRATMAAHDGDVFKTMGDAFCVAFNDAAAAVGAALAAQRALAQADFTAVDGLRVRMGIHAGTAECRERDYFGQTLNRVARLMSAGHGGQVLISGTAAALLRGAAGALQDLGRHHFKDLIEPEQVYQLLAADLPDRFPPLRSLGVTPNNLPHPGTSFIGREAELGEVAALLEQHRLVTLLGSGGVGKTRLSLRLGADLLDRYPDGAWFVELAPISEPILVAEMVADLFALPARTDRSAADMVAMFLRHKRLLLILDNCEHLVAAVAALVDAVIQRTAGVTLLASSREALQVPGEYLFRVPVLAMPDAASGVTAADALRSPSVQLFVARAAAALGRYELSDADTPAVVAICRRLDGIALALELAAARLKLLKPAQLLRMLDDRFRVLTSGNRTVLPRQQTLRGLIDWSHDLLSPPEKILMRRLSVFADSWTLEGAAAVAADEALEEWEILDLLGSLVDKSLVTVDTSGAETRYRFLESTRHYAAEKRLEAGEGDWTARLAVYFARLTRRADHEFDTVPNDEWFAVYEPEFDNLREALDWLAGPHGDPARLCDLVAYSSIGLAGSSHREEQWRWLEKVVPLIDDATPAAVAARIHFHRMTVPSVTVGLHEARTIVALARAAGESVLLASVLREAAAELMLPPTRSEALGYLEESLQVARSLGRTKALARVLGTRAMLLALDGDRETAQKLFAESAEIARATGDRFVSMIVLANTAETIMLPEGDLAGAIRAAREAMETAHAISNRFVECRVAANLGAYLLLVDEIDEGCRWASHALRQARPVGYEDPARDAMQHLTLVAARNGKINEAARLQGYLERAYAEAHWSRENTEQTICDAVLTILERSLEDSRRLSLMAAGAAMSADEASALALAATA